MKGQIPEVYRVRRGKWRWVSCLLGYHWEIVYDDTVVGSCQSAELANSLCELMNAAYRVGVYDSHRYEVEA